MKIEPMGDRVLLKRMEEVTESSGGIILPAKAQHKSNQAVVVAVGPGRVSESGNRLPMTVCPGDHVVAAKHAGDAIEVDGQEMWLVREHDIQYRVRHPEDG